MRLRLPERRLVAWEGSLGSVFLLANPSVRPFLCPVPQGCLNIQVKKCAAASPLLLHVVLLFPQALHISYIKRKEGRHFHRRRNAGLEQQLTLNGPLEGPFVSAAYFQVLVT